MLCTVAAVRDLSVAPLCLELANGWLEPKWLRKSCVVLCCVFVVRFDVALCCVVG